MEFMFLYPRYRWDGKVTNDKIKIKLAHDDNKGFQCEMSIWKMNMNYVHERWMRNFAKNRDWMIHMTHNVYDNIRRRKKRKKKDERWNIMWFYSGQMTKQCLLSYSIVKLNCWSFVIKDGNIIDTIKRCGSCYKDIYNIQ